MQCFSPSSHDEVTKTRWFKCDDREPIEQDDKADLIEDEQTQRLYH